MIWLSQDFYLEDNAKTKVFNDTGIYCMSVSNVLVERSDKFLYWINFMGFEAEGQRVSNFNYTMVLFQ